MMAAMAGRSTLLALLLLAGCGEAAAPDAAAGGDAAIAPDAAAMDAGLEDAGADASLAGPDGGADAAVARDAGTDAAPTDAGAPPPLAERGGCFFTIATAGEKLRVDFGAIGTAYDAVEIEVDLVVGAWREDLFDRDPLNHVAIGVFRDAPISRERYLGGLGVQISPPAAGLRPTTLFFGRVDLEPRPPGEGYTSYTTFRARAPWQNGARYHVAMTFDAAAHRQVLDVTRDGAAFSHVEGDIAYFGRELTDDGWSLELGSDETDGRDVSPVGWQFCDLVVRGR